MVPEWRMTQTMYFVGVRTAGSSIFTLFPRWMEIVGVDAQIEGIDLPLDASPSAYRDVVQHIKADPQVAGAVITAHKLGVYAAAHDLFDVTDPFVSLCREASSISKGGDSLRAHATDAPAANATMRAMLGPGYWARHQANVLCLGAGGAATAIALCLLADLGSIAGEVRPAPIPPRRVLFVDIDSRRLEALRRVVDTVNAGAEVEYFCRAAAEDNDAQLCGLPAASLIINATGLGKDRPGSPLSDAAVFPQGAVVWDLNYRGALPFLAQAQAQQERRQLQVHDGWLYFLHGWTHALSPVLHVDLTGPVFEDLAAMATHSKV
jgi:shikimate 5-dehydrogenase